MNRTPQPQAVTGVRSRQHSWHRHARRLWPRALWIENDPPATGPCFALLSHCPGGLTVTLWPDATAAASARSLLDKTGCAGRCCRRHRILRLDAGGVAVAHPEAPPA